MYWTISFQKGFFLPILNTFKIFLSVQRNPWSSFFFPKSIPHHGDRIHGGFVGLILELDWDYSKVIINIFVGVHWIHGLILFLNLLLWVEDEIEILSFLDSDTFLGEVPFQHRQLLLSPGLIASPEKMLVVWSDVNHSLLAIGEVLHKDMLAKRSIAIMQLGSLIELVGFLLELLLVIIDEAGSSLLELPLAEGI